MKQQPVVQLQMPTKRWCRRRSISGPSIIRVPSGASPLSAPDSSAHSQGHQVPTRVNVITPPICSHSIPMSPGDSHTTPNLGTREPNVQSGTSQIPGMQGHQSSRASAVPPPASHPPPSRHSGPPNEYKAFGAGECVCSTFMPVSGMKRGLAILHVAQGLCIINVAVEAGFSYSQPRNIHRTFLFICHKDVEESGFKCRMTGL